eukprot:scaffold389_cov382-Prasinococcus_capsulatus_cf.AAC.18
MEIINGMRAHCASTRKIAPEYLNDSSVSSRQTFFCSSSQLCKVVVSIRYAQHPYVFPNLSPWAGT